MSAIVWRLSALKSLLTGKPATITKETAMVAQRKAIYNNTKLTSALPQFSYTPVRQSVERIAKAYLNEKS